MVKKSFEENKGKIQQILKENPEAEQKRRENRAWAMHVGNILASHYKPYYEYAEQTGFTEKWIGAVTQENILNPNIRMEIGKELLRQQLIAIGVGSYQEAKNGWVLDPILSKARMAMIRFLLSNGKLPPYPPYRRRGRKPKIK